MAVAVIRLEPIPRPGDLDSDTWVAWCEERNIHPLRSSPRGWWPGTNTCLREATWIGHIEGYEEPILLDDEELSRLQSCPICGCGIEPGSVHEEKPDTDNREETRSHRCVVLTIPPPRKRNTQA